MVKSNGSSTPSTRDGDTPHFVGVGSHVVGEEASERRPCRDELFSGLRPLLTPPKRGVHFAKTSSFSDETRRRRVLKAQRGGSVPSEVRYPGPLTRPCMDTPRSPHLRRTAVPFPEKCGVTPQLREEKTSDRAPLLFSHSAGKWGRGAMTSAPQRAYTHRVE